MTAQRTGGQCLLLNSGADHALARGGLGDLDLRDRLADLVADHLDLVGGGQRLGARDVVGASFVPGLGQRGDGDGGDVPRVHDGQPAVAAGA
jgi:hypothetical protein